MTMNMHICLSATAVWGKMSATPWVSFLHVNVHAFACFDAHGCVLVYMYP